jgi:hypothetical protein
MVGWIEEALLDRVCVTSLARDTATIKLTGFRLPPDDSLAERKDQNRGRFESISRREQLRNNMRGSTNTVLIGRFPANQPWLLPGGAAFIAGAFFLCLGLATAL